MKLIAEYLERAVHFELLAAAESKAELKQQFENQAKAYRKLAAKRANEVGLLLPDSPHDPSSSFLSRNTRNARETHK
jgi:hypothetical protein